MTQRTGKMTAPARKVTASLVALGVLLALCAASWCWSTTHSQLAVAGVAGSVEKAYAAGTSTNTSTVSSSGAESSGDTDASGAAATASASEADAGETIIRVGYYEADPQFQNGYSDDAHKSGFAYDYLQALASVAGWDYEYIYGTKDEMIAALQNGEVDLVVGLTSEDDPQGLLLFSDEDLGLDDQPLYFAVNGEDVELMEEVNEIQKRILRTSPRFLNGLIQKYYAVEASGQGLTDLQSEWLEEKGSLKFGFMVDNLPISGEASDGTPNGVAGVLIDHIYDMLGLPISYVPYSTVDDMLQGLKAGDVDFIFPAYSDLWVSETEGIVQTHEVTSDRAMVVYIGDYREDLTDSVGVYETGLQQAIFVQESYPDAVITTYPDREAALKALSNGEVSCLIGCSTVLERYLSDHAEYDDLNTAFLDKEEGFSMAVREGDGVLAGILNRTVNQLEEAKVTSAMVEFARGDGAYSLDSLIRRNAIPVVAILVIFVAVLLFVFISYRRKTQKYNREQAKTQDRLEQAVVAANAANDAKTTFLSSMSHDIRTPMNGIVGMTAIARANIGNNSKVQNCLDSISASSEHLLALISDILDMSKIESGELNLNEAPMSIESLMDEVFKSCRRQAEEKGLTFVSLTEQIADDEVIGDKVRLQQVFMNLVSNAIKFTPVGGTVEVSMAQVHSVDPKRACFKFVVKDNGVGMSDGFLEHIFEPFSREEKPSGQGGIQGTGLGMAIVRNTLRLMGGDISVKSELGEGSEFTVTLYMMPADASQQNSAAADAEGAASASGALADGVASAPDAADTQNATEGKPGTEQHSASYGPQNIVDLTGKRALLVEDNELNAQIATELFGMTGLVLERAHNGREGVDMMAASEPGYYDCIFMDIQMPVMNGFEAARAIRAMDREDARTMPIFALSADAFNEDKQRALESGMNEHFAKPLDFDLVFEALERYFAK